MQLAGMVDTLKALVDQINASSMSRESGAGAAGDNNNARKIVRILNAHHHSLAWLEETSKKMLADASQVGQRMGLPSAADAALIPP